MVDPFPQLLEDLGTSCPICQQQPMTTAVLGPNDIRLYPCGHSFDAKDWLDEQFEERGHTPADL